MSTESLIPLNYQLSKYITFGMLTNTEHRDLLDINVENAMMFIDNLTKLATDVLDPVWDLIGPFVITSGFRCKQLNIAVNGSLTSQHSDGEAADLIVANGKLKDIFNKIASSDVKYSQLIFEFGRWVHVGLIDEILHPNKIHQNLVAATVVDVEATKIKGQTVYKTEYKIVNLL